MESRGGRPWGKSIPGGLLAALLFLVVWLPLHPSTPPLDTADLYEHLSVARHLVRGEGFLTDLSFPLSFAYPFACHLPQPLVHRGPGFALAMVLPYLAAGRDAARTVAMVRVSQLVLLGGLVWLGSAALWRRRRTTDMLPWLILLGANPLLAYAVDWGFTELAAGLLLLGLWLRGREGQPPDWADGLLAGILTTLRPELVWLPLLWWVWWAMETRNLARRREQDPPPLPWRRLLLAVGVLVALQLPWAVRNMQLTGSPFFSLQAQAELVKDTRAWPGYSVYKQLEPQPVGKVLAGDPVPVLGKVARGARFFTREASKVLPLPLLVLGMLLVFGLVRGQVTGTPCPWRQSLHPPSILPADFSLGPLAAATVSLALMALEYSFFDHSLRHLLPLVPVFTWEASALPGSQGLAALKRRPMGQRFLQPAAAGPVLAAALTLALVLASHRATPGWEFARRHALHEAESRAQRGAAFAAAPAESLFVDGPAVPWYADRAAVWRPGSPSVQATIRNRLGGHAAHRSAPGN